MKQICLAMPFLFLIGCTYNSAYEVQADLKKNLPIGSPKELVINYLNDKGFEHSAGYKDDLYYAQSKTITASAPGRELWLLSYGKVYVTFYFDNRNRLARFEVKKVWTGL